MLLYQGPKGWTMPQRRLEASAKALHAQAALEVDVSLEVVVGSALGWADPWSRVRLAFVERDASGWRTWLVDEQDDPSVDHVKATDACGRTWQRRSHHRAGQSWVSVLSAWDLRRGHDGLGRRLRQTAAILHKGRRMPSVMLIHTRTGYRALLATNTAG